MNLVGRLLPAYRRLGARYPSVVRLVNFVRFHYHYNHMNYTYCRLRGLSYREWYAHVLDQFARYSEAPPHEGLEERMGRYQLEYLVTHGLKPAHCLLDYGCGYLRAGIHFIEYLDPGQYVGAEISSGRLAQGRRLVDRRGLTGKSPILVLLKDLSLAPLHPRKFDFIWSHGVLSHMPVEDVTDLFANLPKIMHEKSVLFANYTESVNTEYGWEGLRHSVFKLPIVERVCGLAGLRCELMEDWEVGVKMQASYGSVAASIAPRDRMLRITLI